MAAGAACASSRTRGALDDALASARREAASAFGDDTVFLEPYVEAPRHVEVQVFADAHGNVVHLFERECSIQRRYQKIVEEAPSPALDDALRARMGEAAVRLAREIGYRGAGTVEFLLAPDGRFFFLEVNTRLQVEHPVTECITGLDLVRLQILVAEGRALPAPALAPRRTGHAIEVRLYAEVADGDGFRPATGTVHRLRFVDAPGLRVEAGVGEGSVVGVHYDPMLAKVIAHAPTRLEAARLLARALRRMQLHGIGNNRDLLVAILQHDEFLAGATDTHFLERHRPADLVAASVHPDAERLHAVAAALAAQAMRRAGARAAAYRSVRLAQRPVRAAARRARDRRAHVSPSATGSRGRARSCRSTARPSRRWSCAAWPPMRSCSRARRCSAASTCTVSGDVAYVDGPLGSSIFRELARHPSGEAELAAGSLVAPMPGIVLRVQVAVGDRVAARDELLVLEAMKMEHRIVAPAAGTIEAVHVVPGASVTAGEVLVVITPEESTGE